MDNELTCTNIIGHCADTNADTDYSKCDTDGYRYAKRHADRHRHTECVTFTKLRTW